MRFVASRDAVVEVDHAAVETSLLQQIDLEAQVVGQGLRAAAHHDGHDEQVQLVHQAGRERLSGESRTANTVRWAYLLGGIARLAGVAVAEYRARRAARYLTGR